MPHKKIPTQLNAAFILSPPFTLLYWNPVFELDKDTRILISNLKKFKPSAIPADIISTVHISYHKHIRQGNIALLGGKTLLFKPLNMGSKFLSLIIVPTTIIRTLFDHYNIGPSGGYTGVYKTMYRLRMRFFWPGLREDIKNGLQLVHIV